MSATAISTPPTVTPSGARKVQLRTDLAGIADLIEVCFSPTMDESGRAAIREMRMVSKSGSLMFVMTGLDSLMGGLELGYVWLEDGKIVGNVSVSRSSYPPSMGIGYIIANVATHPDYRRRHIARLLMMKSLDLIWERGGKFAILQVDVNNPSAQLLYRSLGFREERTFTRWYRPMHYQPPAKLDTMPFITLRQGNQWRAEYELAQKVRPNTRGGMGWQRPTHPGMFNTSLFQTLGRWLTMKSTETWIVRDPSERKLLGWLRSESQFGSPEKLDLMVAPEATGQLEEPLLNYALRRLEERFHSITIEHPADDTAAVAVLEKYRFERKQTTIQMRCDL